MKKYIYLSFIIVLLLFGCDSFLDKSDPEATTFEEFFNTEEDLRRVVYSSYLDVFTNAGNRRTLFYMQEGRSDNAYARIDGDHHQRIANGDYNSSTNAFLYYWEEHGKHLGRLNTFIAAIDAPYVEDESIRIKYKSILEALRVWHYFVMTSQWGDVPFHLEPADMVTAQQPVTPKEEILDQLFELVDDISLRIPEDQYVTDKYMFNKYSLKALAARYALVNHRYELAAKYAKEVIDSGKYSLHPSYKDLFQHESSTNNNEFIMWMDKDCRSGAGWSFRDLGPHFRTGGGQSYMVPLKSLVDSYWTLQGNSIANCPLHTQEEYELNPHLNRDPRYDYSIMGHGDLFYGEEIDIYDENSPMFHEKERASRSGYWFRKYVSESDAFRDGSTTIEYSLLRYAEVLLIYAESKIMLNQIDNETKKYINEIRKRAGLDMTEADVTLPKYDSYSQSDWINLIRNERRIELAGEGQRYLDIIRWKTAEKVLNQPAMGHTIKNEQGKLESLKIEDRSFSSNNYLWPFHETSLKVESGLVQNPGY